MTALIPSTSFSIANRKTRRPVKPLNVQIPGLHLDAEARRLAAAVGRGEEAAFRELYDRYRERLFRFALVLGHGEESLAQDAVQSAFLIAARKLRRIESDDHLWNWLARVTRQQLSKARRLDERHAQTISVPELPEVPEAQETDAVLEENLDAALQTLDQEDRQLIEWFYFDHFSHKEIAERVAASSKAVSSRLERARAKLRALLAKRLSHET